MKLDLSVAEVVQIIEEVQQPPGKVLEMIKTDIPKAVGGYLSEVMQVELTRFLGRKPYERIEKKDRIIVMVPTLVTSP